MNATPRFWDLKRIVHAVAAGVMLIVLLRATALTAASRAADFAFPEPELPSSGEVLAWMLTPDALAVIAALVLAFCVAVFLPQLKHRQWTLVAVTAAAAAVALLPLDIFRGWNMVAAILAVLAAIPALIPPLSREPEELTE